MSALDASDAVDVSVVIPTRNRADLVVGAVESVLSQRPAAAEIIVVDDASSDGTVARLEAFGSRITVHRNQQRIERAAARNLGARLAGCGAVAFLDADDTWLPGKLASQLPALKRGAASVTGIVFTGPDGELSSRRLIPPVPTRSETLWTNSVMGGASSLLVPRSRFLELGGYPTQWALQGSEDWLLMFKLVVAGLAPEVVPRALVAYRVHPGNSTGDAASVARSQSAAVDWLGREGGLSELELAIARRRTAARIARMYANRGGIREASAWLGRVARGGSGPDFMNAAALASASALRGSLRRSRSRGSEGIRAAP